MADIFISYTSTDKNWAFWIAKELEALGHTPHIHEFEVNAGDDIYKWMEERHDAADHVLWTPPSAHAHGKRRREDTARRQDPHKQQWQAASGLPAFLYRTSGIKIVQENSDSMRLAANKQFER